jgi:mevalonate kinase
MKIADLSVGGKTFIAGEYLALKGGPALINATQPRFQLEVFSEQGESHNIFHPQSPAGQFWNLHSDFFSKVHLNFIDPYQIGGFGASSAQFALLHSLWQVRDKIFVEAERFYDWHLMLQDYRQLAHQGSGYPPSGADVVGACAGGLTWFDRLHGKVQTFAWPFLEIEFFVAHTGNKLATHEHLKSLENFETQEFESAMKLVHDGLSQVNFDDFLLGLQNYRTTLMNQGRVAAFTQEKVQELESHSEVLFAKGCGAMGSDVILVLCEKAHAKKVLKQIESLGLNLIADSSKISRSLHIQNHSQSVKELGI